MKIEGEYLLNSTDVNSKIILVGLDSDNRDFWEQLVKNVSEDDYVYVYFKSEPVDAVLGQYTSEGILEDRKLYKVEKMIMI